MSSALPVTDGFTSLRSAERARDGGCRLNVGGIVEPSGHRHGGSVATRLTQLLLRGPLLARALFKAGRMKRQFVAGSRFIARGRDEPECPLILLH
jgi:hypothetical protein